MKSGIAIVPGSFDPITLGHIDLVKRAAQVYDKVYLAVMINDQKKYMFTIEERVAIAKAALGDMDNVEVVFSEGMLWELARDLSANAIVKGVRNDIDAEYERVMAEFNKKMYPSAQTVMLKSNEALSELSSTVVRNRICHNDDLSDLLPESAIKEIAKILKSRQ